MLIDFGSIEYLVRSKLYNRTVLRWMCHKSNMALSLQLESSVRCVVSMTRPSHCATATLHAGGNVEK